MDCKMTRKMARKMARKMLRRASARSANYRRHSVGTASPLTNA